MKFGYIFVEQLNFLWPFPKGHKKTICFILLYFEQTEIIRSDEILDGHLTMKEVCRIYGLYSKVNNTKGARIRNATARNDAIKASLCSCMDTDIICHTSWNLELSSGCKRPGVSDHLGNLPPLS